MNHQDLKILISAYIDGEVTAEERKIVEDHCAECEECHKELSQFKNISLSLRKMPHERLSPDVDLKLTARMGPTKERIMHKQHTYVQWSSLAAAACLLVICIYTVQIYMKRGLQARVRDAGLYLTQQTGHLGTTNQYEPYYLASNYAVDRTSREVVVDHNEVQRLAKDRSTMARMKSATDDIGDQFSSANTGYPRTEVSDAVSAGKFAGNKADTLQMALMKPNEPYDKRPNYALEKKSEEAIISARAYTAIKEQELLAPSPAAVGGVYSMEPSVMNMPVRDDRYREDDALIYAEAFPRTYYPITPVNTESYDQTYENGYLSPVNTPLSTFSIDVDTASYSNIRRYLNQGQLPPTDAVRIEELINYFSYNYPEPMWGQPFSITTEVAPCPWNPSHQLAMIGLKGKRLSGISMPASNLVFLIDVSGSMNQLNKLPLLQDAFRMLAHELEGKDKVSIVVYAGAAGLVLDATPGNYKEQILNAVARLQAGGSTAGGDGIRLAYQVARNNFIPKGNNRVILATDGDFNVGISSDDELVRMIESYRDQGIFLTVLGFGEGNLKDSKMEKLADHGNGNYFYIDNQQEARKVLVNELGSTLFTIAKDVKIQVEFNPATVREYRLIGYENRALAKEDFNNDAKDAGELGAGHTVTALYEMIPEQGMVPEYGVDRLVYQKPPQIIRGNTSDIMTVKLRYKEPHGSISQLIKKTVARRDVHSMIQSDNLRFASAVAEFGLLLRNSPFRGQASFEHVLNQVRSSKPDAFGYRQEFTGLVERARALSPYIAPEPIPMPMVYQDHGQERKSDKGQK